MAYKKSEEFSYEITKHLCDLSEKNKGWVKQLNTIKWNNSKEEVYDIRSWHYPDDSDTPDRMSKGISLSYEEFAILCQSAYDEGIVG